MLRPGLAHRLLGTAVAAALVACSGDEPGVSATDGTTTGTTGATETTTDATTTTTTTTTTSASGETSSSSTTGVTTTTTDGTTTGTTLDTTTTDGVTSTGDTMGGCGDGVLDPGEACDGGELGGADCMSEGFDGGELGCTDACVLDTAACTACGDGELDPGEGCDDGNLDAGDGCDATCAIEEACDPDGQYAVQGAPVAYTCCNGLVTVNINSFLFTADGATIASSPSNPAPMLGAATTCPDGDFANQGSIPGGCTETYAVSGSFVDKDTWMGTYELKFVGDQCSCFNGQFGTPCVNQVFPVTAKR